MENDIYIFDIDGTLADCSHRLYHIQKTPKDWESFHKNMCEDKPILPVLRLLNRLGQIADIRFATGRQEKNRLETAQWLANKTGMTVDYVNYALYMRANGDHREDTVVKPELVERIADRYGKSAIKGIFEDRLRVCEALRAKGYQVYQVAAGAY